MGKEFGKKHSKIVIKMIPYILYSSKYGLKRRCEK